jgi:hypothetical protein
MLGGHESLKDFLIEGIEGVSWGVFEHGGVAVSKGGPWPANFFPFHYSRPPPGRKETELAMTFSAASNGERVGGNVMPRHLVDEHCGRRRILGVALPAGSRLND